jgi:hypothetical protein
LLQIVYISTARTLITEALCQDVLAASRRNNRRADISGLLIAGQRRFLQALEGPAEAVRATYARISADPRHYACVVLSERQVETRQFGDWAMGFTPGGAADADDDSLVAMVTRLVAPLEDPTLRAHFIGFAEVQSQAA